MEEATEGQIQVEFCTLLDQANSYGIIRKNRRVRRFCLGHRLGYAGPPEPEKSTKMRAHVVVVGYRRFITHIRDVAMLCKERCEFGKVLPF